MGTRALPGLLPGGFRQGVDQKPDLMEAKELREVSAKSNGGSHPTVLAAVPQ